MNRKYNIDAPRSDALSRERLRELNEAAAAGCGEALSTRLRQSVEVVLAAGDQISYGDYIEKLDRTSYLTLLRAAPSEDPLLVDVQLEILYPMLDHLLGGGDNGDPPPRRPVSEIEAPLAARLVRLFIDRYCHAWESEIDWNIEVIRAESNPRLLRALSADETVVSIDFRVTIGERRGMIRLCVPQRTIQQLNKIRFSDRTVQSAAERAEAAVLTDPDSTVEVSVTLASTPISAADLSGLQVGDLIVTEAAAGSPAVVSLSGEPKYLAKPVVCGGRNAVSITEPV